MEFRLLPNQSDKCTYNPNLIWFISFDIRVLCVYAKKNSDAKIIHVSDSRWTLVNWDIFKGILLRIDFGKVVHLLGCPITIVGQCCL